MSRLARFHAAQKDSHRAALAELTAGRKESHWMWFVFPQLRGLGSSPTAQHYGLADLDEAREFLGDPDLRARLDACAAAVLGHAGTRPEAILGPVDALKLRSSATLFALAGEGSETGERMQAILDGFYAGEPCPLTLKLLERETTPGAH
ncbi:MAG: DUF1810 domain-containing protein [Alphaproteobacteria bacterium HGW-Alphaproteobacteria-6]|nr:MAG: DUF1810 domain-containing protein [Alphaproteobacteria bacterium HGW-Alphaproteobacteria-6]